MKKELQLFQQLAKIFLSEEKENPVAKVIPPQNMTDFFDIQLNQEPLKDEDWINSLEKVVLNTPKTASKHFFNQLFGGRQSKAVLGDLLAVLLNNSMYTYKAAGIHTGIEKEIINQVIKLINFPETADGTIPTGGSMSNFMGIVLARDAVNESVKLDGACSNLIAYSSMESHYSSSKNAALCGIGMNQIRKINSDAEGKMDIDDLRTQIQKDIDLGLTPFYVNATAGTTVLGAFDPINEIADICQEYGIWLHVDGAYQGGVIFSEKYKHLINGVERADSFCFNPHKMLGVPLTCSVFISRDKKYLYESFDAKAEYLFQSDTDEFNLGKTSFQCGRRNDALKLWTLWKSVGTKGLTKIVETLFDNAKTALEYTNNHPDYDVYSFDNSLSVCFTYKSYDVKKLCRLLNEKQALMVGYANFKEDVFVRWVSLNGTNTKEDILNFFKILEEFTKTHHNELTS